MRCWSIGAFARVEHSDAVGERGYRRADAVTEVLAVRPDAEPVVAARPPRDRHDRELARSRRDDGSLAGGESLGRDRLAVAASDRRAASMTRARRRRFVVPERGRRCRARAWSRRSRARPARSRRGRRSRSAPLERLEDRVRVEWRLRWLTPGRRGAGSGPGRAAAAPAGRSPSARRRGRGRRRARRSRRSARSRRPRRRRRTFSKLGSCPPISQRATCARSRPRRSASWLCVSPALSLASRMICAAVNAPEVYLVLTQRSRH